MTFLTASPIGINSTHQANLLMLLNRRLEVARNHQNQQLVVALESEYAQLTASTQAGASQSVSIADRLETLWMSFAETLSEWTKVHVEETVDSHGKPSWYAYNPQAGQMIFTESKDEMQRWIKRSYWGQ